MTTVSTRSGQAMGVCTEAPPHHHGLLPSPPRSTPSTFSSARAGGTSGWSSTDPCRFYLWTTCWPVRSGLPTPSSTTGRSPWPTTWRRLTSCCAWLTTARCSTPWGEPLGGAGGDGFWAFLSTPTHYGYSGNIVGAEPGRSWWIFELGKWALNHLCVTRSVSVWAAHWRPRGLLSDQLQFTVRPWHTLPAELKKNLHQLSWSIKWNVLQKRHWHVWQPVGTGSVLYLHPWTALQKSW